MAIYSIKGEEDFHTRLAEAKNTLVVVGFFAKWCQPCNVVAPKLRQLAQELYGSLVLLKIEADFCPSLTKRFHITTVPTFFMIRDGKELEYISGSNYQTLKKSILKLIHENEEAESKSDPPEESSNQENKTPLLMKPTSEIMEEKMSTPELQPLTIVEETEKREKPELEPKPEVIIDEIEKPISPALQPQPPVIVAEIMKPIVTTEAICDVNNATELDERLVGAGDTLVIIACLSKTCRPCMSIKPLLPEIAKDFIRSVIILRVDVEDCPSVLEKYGITNFPTFVMMKNVTNELHRFSGADEKRLRKCIEEFK